MATITAANAQFFLVVSSVFPVPQQIQGFGVDTAFTTEAVEHKEIKFGVDGRMSAGYIFNPVVTTIAIMPDSPSLLVFDLWQQAEQVLRESLIASATIKIDSIRRKYALTKGHLTSSPPIVSANRTLAEQQFRITWESVVGEPY